MQLGDLPQDRLGATLGYDIYIDGRAAGRGWYVDLAPQDDQEFALHASASTLVATSGEAASRMDLLTTVTHEMGNAMGFAEIQGAGVMSDTLSTGVRLLIDKASLVDAVRGEASTLTASPDSAAYVQMDLVTLLTHEAKQVLGGGDAANDEDLSPALRYLLDKLALNGDPDRPIDDAALAALAAQAAALESSPGGLSFDFDSGASGSQAGIDWQADPNAAWGTSYSPYAAPSATDPNFSDYLIKVSSTSDPAAGNGSG